MTLSDLAIRNPFFAVMRSAATIVFGYLGYRDMGVRQFPEIDFRVVSIVITREAASPDPMDGDVTDIVAQPVARGLPAYFGEIQVWDKGGLPTPADRACRFTRTMRAPLALWMFQNRVRP
jgi:hypothetical protein